MTKVSLCQRRQTNLNIQNSNISEMLIELRNDNSSGANELIAKALEIIKFQLKMVKDPFEDIKEAITDLARDIINSRPSMAPIINTIGFILNNLKTISKNKIKERITKFEDARTARYKALEKNFADFLNLYCKSHCKIMLISYSSTVINFLKKNSNSDLEIYVLESRPLLEGRKTAEILSQFFKTHLIVDAGMGKFIDEIDLVLIGVDSILKDGSIINKIGTFPLAITANAHNIDVYAVTDSYKYNLKSHYNQKILIEEKPIKEIYDKEVRCLKIKIHNYYFDITPSKYIKGFISEYGILSVQEFVDKIQQDLPIEWFKYFLINKNI
ncbi:MAG: hypothetical protein CEE43_19250 [Promethearchaeota archaeon Loki_b32]|nr:MAG: hypothetical protein CEE43_19250 [Candidatus Lokiarchaeota archaeon Loki_b32]